MTADSSPMAVRLFMPWHTCAQSGNRPRPWPRKPHLCTPGSSSGPRPRPFGLSNTPARIRAFVSTVVCLFRESVRSSSRQDLCWSYSPQPNKWLYKRDCGRPPSMSLSPSCSRPLFHSSTETLGADEKEAYFYSGLNRPFLSFSPAQRAFHVRLQPMRTTMMSCLSYVPKSEGEATGANFDNLSNVPSRQ